MPSINQQYLLFEWKRISRMPGLTIIQKVVAKLIGFALGFVLIPVTCILHLAGYRHVTIFTGRIGHLALEPDCFLKAQSLGQFNQKKWILLAPAARVANEHLLTYWEPHFIVIRNRAVCFLIRNMSRFFFMRYDAKYFIRNIGKSQAAYSIYTAWGDRSPIISLTKEDEAWGRERLALLGLPNDAWFVCVHARESGVFPADDELQHHRNCKIENTFDAIEEIVRRGGWVIRIGDPSMKLLPPIDKVIDYAHHPLKSERLDIILCAMSRFILGNTSGIALVGTVFGVPCALTNMVPKAALGVSKLDISIPKLYWSIGEQRHLAFREVFNSRSSQYQLTNSQFVQMGIRLVENTSDEIKELVIEMMDHLGNGQCHDQSAITLSNAYISMLGPNHYSFGAASCVSENFLKRYKSLMY